jgi:AcrR family transcriptional regulator
MEAPSTYQANSKAAMKSKDSTIDEAPLRADAARNRERILEAAEALFIERGADASLDDIAKRANVGIGTLYRRFPTRDALLAATSDERLLALAEASRARDEKLDPAASIRAFVKELVNHANHYRGLAALLGTVLQEGTPGCHAGRDEGCRLLQRAQKAGVVRKDVSIDDLVCVVTAIALAVEQGGSTKSRVAHLVDIFLDGIGNSQGA